MGQKRACSEIKHRKKSNSNIVMKDRIRQIMEDQHLNQQNFAQLIGKSTATLSSIFNDRTKPSLDIVDAIKKKLPQVNLEWLLYGTPPMYINKVEGAQAGASARGGNGADEDSLDMYGDAVGVAGTGASAAVVAAVLNRFTEPEVCVELPGGKLEVEWNSETQHVFLTGGVRTVFEGEINEII